MSRSRLRCVQQLAASESEGSRDAPRRDAPRRDRRTDEQLGQSVAPPMDLSLKPVPAAVAHPEPDLTRVDRALSAAVYAPPRDGVESNLLVLFHGLGESAFGTVTFARVGLVAHFEPAPPPLPPRAGDTAKPFAQLGRSLNLPQTAVLALQAPKQIPLLEEEAYQWWDSFDQLGDGENPPLRNARVRLQNGFSADRKALEFFFGRN